MPEHRLAEARGPLGLALALLLALGASGALAQSRSSTTVNGITVTVVSDGSQSVEATGDGARVLLDGEEVVIGPGTIEAQGMTLGMDPFGEVLVERLGATLRIEVDGEEVLSVGSAPAEERSLEEMAAEGDAGAQNNLAVALFNGDGVPADPARAAALLREAAAQGLATAQSNLAQRLWAGNGMAQDTAEALEWARLAADQGDLTSTAILGMALVLGDGTAPDPAEGARLLALAAEGGHAGAQSVLGQYLVEGELLPQDLARGLDLLEGAAEAGDADALNYLGFLHGSAQAGLPVDHARAADLYLRAAEAGNLRAATNLGRLHLDSGGVAPSREVAIEWTRIAAEAGWEGAQEVLDRLLALGESVPPAAGPSAELRYFWADGRTAVGPLSLAELRSLLAEGTIGPATLVWEEGAPDWVRADALPALASP